MNPHQYCAEKAASSGSSFYYAFKFLPPRKREAIQALYAFCREVDDAVDNVSDPAAAAARLAFWRGEVEEVFGGRPQHPVGQALAEACTHFQLDKAYFLEIIDGVEMDLHTHRYESFSDLQLYCYRVASVVGLLSIEIFGYGDRGTRKYAHKLGIAFQLTNILRDVGEDAGRGRIYIPQEDLRAHGVAEGDILEGQPSEAFSRLMDFEIDRALDYYRQALEELPECDRYNQLPGLIMAAIYRKTLQEVAEAEESVLRHEIRLTPLRKFWIAWRTYREERKRAKRVAKH
ncbi:presqualene diphosphate synthase HpnD [Thiohalorhabdus sp. Cl-TMA]|uniref:Presqualene diphosphate synthase HpnD n=1 Tax=Thiohalorhabdus methylotrophus TaxID=3242694 RepID=A0ABV4TZJ8_9GAMM